MSEYLDRLRAEAEAEFARTTGEQETQQPEPTSIEAPTETTVEAPQIVEAPEAVEQPQESVEQRNRRTVYKKVVDLGDGSPPQVFTAATKDELIDKILKAQFNATKRIKELKSENKKLLQNVQPDLAQPTKNYAPKDLSTDEELEIASELQSSPRSAVSKVLKAELGADLDELRKDLNDLRALRQQKQIQEIGNKFIAAHPEYPITPKNEQLMAEYIQKNSLAWTQKNLELAFADLVDASLIVLANTEDQTSELEEIEEVEVPPLRTPAQQPALAAEPVLPTRTDTTSVEVPRRRKAVVGISSSQAVATAEPGVQHEASVEDLLKLPPSERRRIVLAQMSRQA